MPIRSRRPARVTPRWLVAALLLVLVALPTSVLAQSAAQRLGPADRAEIANFRLDVDVLARLQAVVAESRRMQVRRGQLDMSQVHSLDDMAHQLVTVDPRIKPLLARHGFTPHQFVVANLALVTTAMAVSMKRDPGGASMPTDTANMRFYEHHEAQINRLLQSGSAQ
jgi:hypothetical protein